MIFARGCAVLRVEISASGPPKGRALVYRLVDDQSACRVSTKGGGERGRTALRPRSTASWLGGGARPPSPDHPHNEHPPSGYRTAEPSDSPPPSVTLCVARLDVAEIGGGVSFASEDVRKCLRSGVCRRALFMIDAFASIESRPASLSCPTATVAEGFPFQFTKILSLQIAVPSFTMLALRDASCCILTDYPPAFRALDWSFQTTGDDNVAARPKAQQSNPRHHESTIAISLRYCTGRTSNPRSALPAHSFRQTTGRLLWRLPADYLR